MTAESEPVPARVLIVDDHALFREALVAALSACGPAMTIVGQADAVPQALALVGEQRPDLVLMDLELPGVSGIAGTREIRRLAPATRVLVVSMLNDDEHVAAAFAAGADGYVLKDQGIEDLLEAIDAVLRGHNYLSPRITAGILDAFLRTRGEASLGSQGDLLATVPTPLAALSPREREIFEQLVRGASNDDIAKTLAISVRTVETHRGRMMQKLHARSLAELIRYAATHGFFRS